VTPEQTPTDKGRTERGYTYGLVLKKFSAFQESTWN